MHLFAVQTGRTHKRTGVEPGHSIGKVSTDGNLVVMELDDVALGKANLFDLVGQTLRFTPDGSRYRVNHGPLNWDSISALNRPAGNLLFISLLFHSPARSGIHSSSERPDQLALAREKRTIATTVLAAPKEVFPSADSNRWRKPQAL